MKRINIDKEIKAKFFRIMRRASIMKEKAEHPRPVRTRILNSITKTAQP